MGDHKIVSNIKKSSVYNICSKKRCLKKFFERCNDQYIRIEGFGVEYGFQCVKKKNVLYILFYGGIKYSNDCFVLFFFYGMCIVL